MNNEIHALQVKNENRWMNSIHKREAKFFESYEVFFFLIILNLTWMSSIYAMINVICESLMCPQIDNKK